MSEKEEEIALTKLIRKNRKSIEKDFNKNFEIQGKTLAILTGGLEHANFNSFKTVSVVWNLSIYLNLISFDLKVICKDLMFEEGVWQRKLYARQAYLLIYESMNGFLSLIGTSLKNAIDTFDDKEMYLENVRIIAARLNAFKKEYEQTIVTVRHTSIAHRDKDTLVQLKSIESISWLKATEIVTKFDGIVRDLGQVCQLLMNRATDELYQDETIPKARVTGT
ncbi:MAG: hypothetical protein H7319_09640 [Spirosoma sp.]|nr:hypothetical protein [Spirosoma sp.]